MARARRKQSDVAGCRCQRINHHCRGLRSSRQPGAAARIEQVSSSSSGASIARLPRFVALNPRVGAAQAGKNSDVFSSIYWILRVGWHDTLPYQDNCQGCYSLRHHCKPPPWRSRLVHGFPAIGRLRESRCSFESGAQLFREEPRNGRYQEDDHEDCPGSFAQGQAGQAVAQDGWRQEGQPEETRLSHFRQSSLNSDEKGRSIASQYGDGSAYHYLGCVSGSLKTANHCHS